MTRMSIDIQWLPPFQGTPEIQRTSATIQIRVGGENATRCWDLWSESVQGGARVSAFPLAMWLASSWWRIRWEPLPSRIRLNSDQTPTDANWRMSHEVPAAGYGFIWPQLDFVSDGESIRVICRQSQALSQEPVRYLSEFEVPVEAREFETEIDSFIDLVLRRLDGLGQTELHQLWSEVQAERADRDQSAARRIEARLGYDADEAPPSLLEQLLELAAKVGADATDEVAPICAGSNPMGELKKVMGLASGPGVHATIAIAASANVSNGTAPPWRRARQLATSVRHALGLGTEPLSDRTLSELLRIPQEHLRDKPSDNTSIGLGVREGDELKLLFHKRNRLARRFEAARFIGDHLSAKESDLWLPITDAATARQKLQRAFAAEFLCPIDSLRSYLGDEFLPEAFEEASEYFEISEMAIKSHLANHHLIPRTMVDSDSVS